MTEVLKRLLRQAAKAGVRLGYLLLDRGFGPLKGYRKSGRLEGATLEWDISGTFFDKRCLFRPTTAES